MLKKLIYSSFIVLLTLIFSPSLKAQSEASVQYSPYSIYGVGLLFPQGSVNNKGMAGVGIATRSRSFINYINPASISYRDSLSFMFNAALMTDSRYMQQHISGESARHSIHNIYDVNHIVFSVPIYKKSAFVMGLCPYSSVDYSFYSYLNKPDVVANAGNVYNIAKGTGGLYNVFLGSALNVGNRLSLGFQLLYYFGNINKYSKTEFVNPAIRSFENYYSLQLHSLSSKLGIQYEQPLKQDYKLNLGLTYKFASRLSGYINQTRNNIMGSKSTTILRKVDTLLSKNAPMLPMELAAGICLEKKDNWQIELDYQLTNTLNNNFERFPSLANKSDLNFAPKLAHSVALGMEIVPNANDIRSYLMRCSYRFGAYYRQEPFSVANRSIDELGLTLGFSLPIVEYNNAISFAVDLGRRGTLSDNLLRETYAKFIIGIDIFSIWFIKPRYN